MKKNGTMDVERYETPQAESITIEVGKSILQDSCNGETGGGSETPGCGNGDGCNEDCWWN